MMQAKHLLWMVESTPDSPLGPALEPLIPKDSVLVTASLRAPWRAPSSHRPIAVVVGIALGAADRATQVIGQVSNRTHLPILALFERPSAELKQAVLEAGAVATLTVGTTDLARQRAQRQLTSALKLVLEGPQSSSDLPSRADVRVIAIGASTGGPETLASILPGYGPFDPPIVIAQHVHPGYDEPLAAFLKARGLPCRVAATGDAITGGNVLLAPAGTDLIIESGRVALHASRSQYVPCVDALLESVALEYGGYAIGMVLTGMGDDGAKGLRAMRDKGAFTIAQRGDTCVVDGMPASARALAGQAVDWSPSEIRDFLTNLRDPALTA